MAADPTVAALGGLPPGVELSPPKRRLYEMALELFGEQGYHAVSIRDIANALGQQSSAIYFHVRASKSCSSTSHHRSPLALRVAARCAHGCRRRARRAAQGRRRRARDGAPRLPVDGPCHQP